MRQIWITRAGPPEVLEVKEAPDPEPRAGEVRIRVETSGVNFADIIGRMGLYPDLPPFRSCRLRGRGSRRRGRRRAGRKLDRPRCRGDDAFRRLCGYGLRSGQTGLRAPTC